MSKSNRSLRILIVDDNLTDVMVAFHPIFQQGHRITLCLDGKDALLETEYDNFDFVILDWKMPVFSGGEFLKRVNRDQLRGDAPLKVILHTSSQLELSDVEVTGRFNLVDIWRKPLAPLDIVRRFNRLRGAA